MKKWLLLLALGLFVSVGGAIAGDNKDGGAEILRRSTFKDANRPGNTSFPMQFTETTQINNKKAAAISTGYYFVDNADKAPDYWKPNEYLYDTSETTTLWRRIIPGPRIQDTSYWRLNPDEGLRFFRNPAKQGTPAAVVEFFNQDPSLLIDSTKNAIAGPMPIGFSFYFNGIRYDSFYVSTNGVIALTNRRYFYDVNGNRTIPAGATSAYDPMSMDWMAAGRTRQTGADAGLTDPLADDFGYINSVLGGTPSASTAGIRSSGGPLQNMSTAANKGAYIAPFWGNLHLSQFNPNTNLAEDFGKVYFKRTMNGDKLIIYFVNMLFEAGGYATAPGLTWNNLVSDARAYSQNGKFVSANAQVILNRVDSSVTFLYEKFIGGVQLNAYTSDAAMNVFRMNTTAGVTGWARQTNYNSKTGVGTSPWDDAEYQQTTHVWSNGLAKDPFPYNGYSAKFKQWRNVLRVADIQYKVRKKDPNLTPPVPFTEVIPTTQANNYELLAGEELIGALQPVALIQNLTNDVQGPQGVNYVPQDLNFRARFQIVNKVNERVIYNRLVNITQKCLNLDDDLSDPDCQSDPYNRVRLSSVTVTSNNYVATPEWPLGAGKTGIPPYGFVQVSFPPFEPNEFTLDHIGRMRAYIIADPTDPVTKEPLGDQWPFDDTASVNMFVMKRLNEFYDDVTEMHSVEGVVMPSVYKWVDIDAVVQDGDQISDYAVPPRGLYYVQNKPILSYNSPCISVDRWDFDNQSNSGTAAGGDQLRSFPIDMRNRQGSVLSISLKRGPKKDDWERGYSDNRWIGVEGYIFDGSAPTAYNAYGAKGYDAINVEIMRPSEDGINNITNVSDNARWRYVEGVDDEGNAVTLSGRPALTVFGGGGYAVGISEKNRNIPLPFASGFRYDVFDDGNDYEFKKYFVPISDYFLKTAQGAKNFRFRVFVQAWDNQLSQTTIPDDNDQMYIDNIRILFPSEQTDLEASTVKVLWPYTMAPASQATELPIKVKLSNNTEVDAPSFSVKVKIFRGKNITPTSKPVYCRITTVTNLKARSVLELSMPNWNAKRTGAGLYRIFANVITPGGDLEPLNDTTYTDVTLRFGDNYAYDPVGNPTNNVSDDAFTGIFGRGLNLLGYNYGGTGAGAGSYADLSYVAGDAAAGGSGSIAMKFELLNTDTVRGIDVYFADKNQAMDDIVIALYKDASGMAPSTTVPGAQMWAYRGLPAGYPEPVFKQYITYTFAKPIILNKGTWWAGVSQLGQTGFELGASKSRMGMKTTVRYINPQTNVCGENGYNFMIDKQLRKNIGTSNKLQNNNLFCYENIRGYDDWRQFMPSVGNPGYAHLHHYGYASDGQSQTMTRGTWLPMIRPYFGDKSYTPESRVVQECSDDIPVELTSFTSATRQGAIDLMWETASEQNNYGFYVDRRREGENDNAWRTLGFIKGSNTTNTVSRYNYSDVDVKLNTTYQYRLRQIDVDGTEGCNNSILTEVYNVTGSLVLEPNSPNPFTNNTVISFTLPAKSAVKLEVLDMLGNVVKTIVDAELDGSYHSYNWDSRDNSGRFVESGTYMFRLTAGQEVLTGKMSLVR